MDMASASLCLAAPSSNGRLFADEGRHWMHDDSGKLIPGFAGLNFVQFSAKLYTARISTLGISQGPFKQQSHMSHCLANRTTSARRRFILDLTHDPNLDILLTLLRQQWPTSTAVLLCTRLPSTRRDWHKDNFETWYNGFDVHKQELLLICKRC